MNFYIYESNSYLRYWRCVSGNWQGDRADLDRAIEVQRQTGQKLGRILIDLGTVSEEDLRLAYGKLLQIPIWEKKKEDRYPLIDGIPKVFL